MYLAPNDGSTPPSKRRRADLVGQRRMLTQGDDRSATGKKISPHSVYEALDLHPRGTNLAS